MTGNGHDERLGSTLRSLGLLAWPSTKEQVKEVKESHEQARAEIEKAQAAVEADKRLKEIDRLACEIRYLVRMKDWEKIRVHVKKISELVK